MSALASWLLIGLIAAGCWILSGLLVAAVMGMGAREVEDPHGTDDDNEGAWHCTDAEERIEAAVKRHPSGQECAHGTPSWWGCVECIAFFNAAKLDLEAESQRRHPSGGAQ